MGGGAIFIGIGGNLASERFGPPLAVLTRAVAMMPDSGIHVIRRSRWYRSAPLPPSDQPPFVNAVVQVETELAPEALLAALLGIEAALGRVRSSANAARVVDLDLLAYGAVVRDESPPLLPHPRLHGRAFVLAPLADLAPDWRHPRLQRSVRELLAALPPGQAVQPLAVDDAGGPAAAAAGSTLPRRPRNP